MPAKKLCCRVMVADDYPPDLALLMIALKTMTEFRVVHQAADGGDVIAYLKGDPPFNNRRLFPLPHLLILDLKMPRVDGFDVLNWIRANPVVRLIIVVLTGSENPDDAARARDLGADAVFLKPIGLTHIREMISRVERFMETAPKGIRC